MLGAHGLNSFSLSALPWPSPFPSLSIPPRHPALLCPTPPLPHPTLPLPSPHPAPALAPTPPLPVLPPRGVRRLVHAGCPHGVACNSNGTAVGTEGGTAGGTAGGTYFAETRLLDLGNSVGVFELECAYDTPPVSYLWPSLWALFVLVVYSLLALAVWALCCHLVRLERGYQRMQRLKDRMKAAKLVAEHAAKAKSNFLAVMSHELRTPLNAVIGMMNLLVDTPLDATQLDYAETARTSGRALVSLINDILDLSKIEANRMVLEKAPLDIRRDVDEVLTMFVERFREKPQVEVAAYVDPSVPQLVLGDSLRLRQ
ncbi:unnamed protein product, partial [Closterium sp. NIES-54]